MTISHETEHLILEVWEEEEEVEGDPMVLPSKDLAMVPHSSRVMVYRKLQQSTIDQVITINNKISQAMVILTIFI